MGGRGRRPDEGLTMAQIAVNGIHLNVEVAGSGAPLMLLHGFTGCATGWRPFNEGLTGFTTIAVDLVGHGASDSPREIEHYRMDACVDDLASVLDALGVERTALLGYSMGGRAALHFALRHQDRLSALVLESASPGFDDPAERAARIKSDEELAGRIERDGIEPFVDYWERLPLWASHTNLHDDVRQGLRAQRLRNATVGLANSLRGMGAGAQEPVMGRLSEIKVPTLFLTGALDARYVALANEMASRVQGAEVRILPDAGHAAHLERPDAFAAKVTGFLSRCMTTTPTGGAR
jgi:2-succinyl-6-hydroxy-2,4-cyclohexadiene-1-carboxylate synthase